MAGGRRPRDPGEALEGRADQRVLADQRDEGFRHGLPTRRPEARPRAAGQHDRPELRVGGLIFPTPTIAKAEDFSICGRS